jgi:hypothetical protein
MDFPNKEEALEVEEIYLVGSTIRVMDRGGEISNPFDKL